MYVMCILLQSKQNLAVALLCVRLVQRLQGWGEEWPGGEGEPLMRRGCPGQQRLGCVPVGPVVDRAQRWAL